MPRPATRMVLCTRCDTRGVQSPMRNLCNGCYRSAMSDVVTIGSDMLLARWLSSRVDERGRPLEDSALVVGNKRLIAKRVAEARKRKLDWVHPPEAMTTEQVWNMVLNRPPSKRGAKRKVYSPLDG